MYCFNCKLYTLQSSLTRSYHPSSSPHILTHTLTLTLSTSHPHTLTPSHHHTLLPSHPHTLIPLHPHTSHSHTLAPSHPTLSYPCTLTPSHSHTLAPSHPHTLMPLHPHTLTLSYPHTLTPSHSHTLTPSHAHTLIPSHPHALTPPSHPGFGWCIISLACAIALGFFDKRAEKILKRKEGKVGEVIRLKDIFYFPLSLWLVFLICVFYYVTVFPYIGLAV